MSSDATDAGASVPTASFVASLAASAHSTTGGPSWRANTKLFDEFKNSRVKAAASSLQQRFNSSIHALNRFDEYQKTKDKDSSRLEETIRANREEERASLERSVMKPKIKPTLFNESTTQPPNTKVNSGGLSASMLRSAASSIAPSPYSSPARQSRSSSHFPIPPLPLSAIPHGLRPDEKENENIAYRTLPSQPAPPLSPAYVPPRSRSASRRGSVSQSTNEDVVSKAQSRIRHIEKAMEKHAGDSDVPLSEPVPAAAAAKPTVHLTEDAVAAAADPLPVSRPISVSSGLPRTSPFRANRDRSRSRSRRGRKSLKETLPSHVTRLMAIQSAHAARVGFSSEEDAEEQEELEEMMRREGIRRKALRRPPSPQRPEDSPKLARYVQKEAPNVNEEKEQESSRSTSSRVPINRLAQTLLASDDSVDPRTFLDLPTPKEFVLQSYESAAKPTVTTSANGSNVHIHLHAPTTAAPQDFHHARSSSPLPASSAAASSSAASHTLAWDRLEAESERLKAQEDRLRAQMELQRAVEEQRRVIEQQQAELAAQRRAEELYHDARLYQRASIEADQDAEFDTIQSLLTSSTEDGPGNELLGPQRTTSMQPQQQQPGPSRPSQQVSHPAIDNYSFPPRLYSEHPEDAIIETVLNTVEDAPLRASRSSRLQHEPFQYTQTIYQPDLQQLHRSNLPARSPLYPYEAWSSPSPSPSPLSSGPNAFEPLPHLSARFHGSVPARSFFQPNGAEGSGHQPQHHHLQQQPHVSLSQNLPDLSHYPPVLREQLQQRFSSSQSGFDGRDSPDGFMPSMTSFSASPPRARDRGRSGSPVPASQPNLTNSVLMSPTRLAAYLQHYLHHRTQVEPAKPDPSKVSLTQEEAAKLNGVIVELNSLRSAHELSKEGQQIVTSLHTVPDGGGVGPSSPKSVLAQSKPPRRAPRPPYALPGAQEPPSVEKALNKADVAAQRRSQARREKDEARLTEALVRIAAQKQQETKLNQQHAKKLATLTKKPAKPAASVRSKK